VLNNKVVFDATIMKMYVLDAQHFIAELSQNVMRVTVVNCSRKCEFGLNSCSEDETELSIAKDDWCQLRAARISYCHCRLRTSDGCKVYVWSVWEVGWEWERWRKIMVGEVNQWHFFSTGHWQCEEIPHKFWCHWHCNNCP